MKKVVSFLLITLLLVGALAACAEAPAPELEVPAAEPPPVETEAPPLPEETPEPPGMPERSVPNFTPPNIRVQHAPDEIWDQFDYQPPKLDLDQFDAYREFDACAGEVCVRVAITAAETLREFRFVEIEREFDNDSEVIRATILYSMEELSPETPFVAQVLFLCFPSNRGIVFYAEEYEMDRLFSIFASGYDGALFLVEETDFYIV